MKKLSKTEQEKHKRARQIKKVLIAVVRALQGIEKTMNKAYSK